MTPKHIKGLHLVELVRPLRSWRKAHPNTPVPHLVSEDQVYLTSERIMPGAWYPLDQWLRFMFAVHKVFFGGNYSGMVQIGRINAQTIFPSVYRMYIKTGNPLETVQAVVRNMGSHHDFGLWQFEPQENGGVFHVEGYEDMGEIHGTVYLGWFEVIVELSGAKFVSASILRAPWKGDRAYKLEIRWKPPHLA